MIRIVEDVITNTVGLAIERKFFGKSNDYPKYITQRPSQVGAEFSHREDTVNELYKAIKQNRKLALINGLGGIGKTTIAKALYHKVEGKFKHIAWIEYQNSIKDSLLNSFTIFNEIEDKETRYKNIEKFLLEATKDTIIFIDNVSSDDGMEFIERLNANVVLTSRLDMIGNFEVFPIDFLSEKECINIFYKYYKHDKTRENEESVCKLVGLVKCHTLSVELLARAANRPGYSLDTYAENLKEKGLEYPERSVKTGHTAIAKTIAQHLQALFELVTVSDEQKRILKNFAHMPSIEIPAEVEKWIGCHIDDISQLTKLGWLGESETGYEMHPVVKEAVLLQSKEVRYEDFEAIIDYMSSGDYIKDTDVYVEARVKLGIAEGIMGCFCGVKREEIGRLFNNIAYVYNNRGEYQKALEWYDEASEIAEAVLGLEHPATATSYNNIGGVYTYLGEYTKALEWHGKALEICEKVLGLEHSDTSISYNSIGFVYACLGEYTKALEWYQKALEIREKMLGLEHPSTATSYNNIGGMYDSLGKYPEALEWYYEALKIDEKVSGLWHPDTARNYNNIGFAYANLGDYPKALELYDKALKIYEKVLGPEHPSTIITKENIADVKAAQD